MLHWPSFPPLNYHGQLDPEFQAWLKNQENDVTVGDCEWYHTVQLRSGEVIEGAWDLRGGEREYLGQLDLGGQRVLELGPATGYLTAWMEESGANVVGFEAGYDVSVDLLPVAGRDMFREKAIIMKFVERVHHSWWYLQRDLGMNAKLAFGNIYHLPEDLGHFDTSVFGAILLHLRDPWGALSEAAARTTRHIIVTDVLEDGLDPSVNAMRFATAGRDALTNWWIISPGTVVEMVQRLGFQRTSVHFHTQSHHLGHAMNEPAVQMNMFTVVGSRS
ncbi:MAG: class I SAM-dependent methyltransferase [Acidimicrobiales bacterium]